MHAPPVPRTPPSASATHGGLLVRTMGRQPSTLARGTGVGMLIAQQYLREQLASAVHKVRADAHLQEDLMQEAMLFFFQAEDGIRDLTVTGVQTCALPI